MFCSKWSIGATVPLVVIYSNAVSINIDLIAPDLGLCQEGHCDNMAYEPGTDKGSED